MQTSSKADIDTFANLCGEADLGFDNWSNAQRFLQPSLHPRVSEYFDQSILGEMERDFFLVAIASLRKTDIIAVLRNWKIITLKNFTGLERLI